MTTFTKGQKVLKARGTSRYIRIGEEVTVASVDLPALGEHWITLEGHGDKEFLADDFDPVDETPAPLKPGQVWAATADPEETYRVIEVRDGDVWSENRYGSHVVLSASLFPNDRQLVTDATPAPIDPAKVKAGDTVTLTKGEAKIEDEADRYYPAQPTSPSPHATITLATTPGAFPLSGPHAWTLTAHQPAPEPEPEWKPGTVAEGTINGKAVRGVVGHARTGGDAAFVYWNEFAGHLSSTNTLPADVRPLVVIDPAKVDVDALASAIAHELGLMPNEVEPMHREAAVGAIRALGLEAS